MHVRRPFSTVDLKSPAKAAGVHLLVSALIEAVVGTVVFAVWYPGAFRYMAGGKELFLLLTSIDVVLGPLLTFIVFNRDKGRRLGLDLAFIGCLQLAAFLYGVHTIYVARPVAMVFEVDRFRLASANDVAVDELARAATEYRQLPMTGPLLLGTRAPKDAKERSEALFKGLDGVDIGSRPLFWQPYSRSREAAVNRSRPLSILLAHYAAQAKGIRQALNEVGADESTGRFVPAIARGDWIAVMDGTGQVLGYLPIDGFF